MPLSESIRQNLVEQFFGPPEEQARRRAQYFRALLLSYPETAIREALAALLLVPRLEPAFFFLSHTDVWVAPLTSLLEPVGFPYFTLEKLTEEAGHLVIEIHYGTGPLTVQVEVLAFRREAEALRYLPKERRSFLRG